MDIVTSAKFLATTKHVLDNRQLYGDLLPYTHHLDAVDRVLQRFGWDDAAIRAAAWLHDIVEDTRDKPNEIRVRSIKELFGKEVAELVDAVTTEPGPNRKMRNAATYPKIRRAGVRAVCLKLADRIANIEYGGDAIEMYRKEHDDFRHGIFLPLEGANATVEEDRMISMWHYLNGLIKPEVPAVQTPPKGKYDGKPEHAQSRWEPK